MSISKIKEENKIDIREIEKMFCGCQTYGPFF
jgi:hypothetical protein